MILATKGLTIVLDEFYTSKQCPCGESELEDHPDVPSTEDLRIRRHKTYGPNGKCCVEYTLQVSRRWTETCLPLQTFLWCVKCALRGESRPNHLWQTLESTFPLTISICFNGVVFWEAPLECQKYGASLLSIYIVGCFHGPGGARTRDPRLIRPMR